MLFNEIWAFVKKAHEGQCYGKHPYTTHLWQVQEKVYELFGADKCTKRVALLHDVLEDTEYTEQDLLDMGIIKVIVDAVVLCTKTEDVGYTKYLRKISRNELAFKVKVADTYCNMTESIKEGNIKRVRKYGMQIEKLYKLRKEVVGDKA